MTNKTYEKLIEILKKKNSKKIVVADSQRNKRFNNIVYKNFKNMYNRNSE